MAVCAELSAGIAFDCDNLPVSGVEADQLYLINREDIASLTFDPANNLLVTAITLKAGGKQAYLYEGINNSVRPSFENATDGFSPFKYTHTCEFRVFSRDAATKLQVNNMIGGDLVAIYVRKGETVEIMGERVGLTNNTVVVNEYEEDGAFLLTLSTDVDQGEYEPKPPLSFLDTDFATTITALEALLTPTV